MCGVGRMGAVGETFQSEEIASIKACKPEQAQTLNASVSELWQSMSEREVGDGTFLFTVQSLKFWALGQMLEI